MGSTFDLVVMMPVSGTTGRVVKTPPECLLLILECMGSSPGPSSDSADMLRRIVQGTARRGVFISELLASPDHHGCGEHLGSKQMQEGKTSLPYRSIM